MFNKVNIYVIDSNLFPEENLLPDYDLNLSRNNIKKNALTDEIKRILYIDSRLLKELITCIMMFLDSHKMNYAIAKVRINGLESYQYLWDPNQNPKLQTSDFSKMWVKLYQGAIAFIIGHELGHIYLGKPDNLPRSINIFKKRDRDLHWACPELVTPKYRQIQEIETKSDNFCAGLLKIIKYELPLTNTIFLRYELGAHWLLQYYLENEIINAVQISESQIIIETLNLQI